MLTLVSIVAASWLSAASAASFDCRKASTTVERIVCATPALSQLDDELKATFDQALTRVLDQAALRTSQRDWLVSVRNACTDEPCLRMAYATRITALKPTAVASAPVASDVIGTYKSTLGILHVRQQSKGKAAFELSVSRDTNTGEVSGEASLRGASAVYVNRADDCMLTFAFASGQVSIVQSGTCGMALNVTGTGEYVRDRSRKP